MVVATDRRIGFRLARLGGVLILLAWAAPESAGQEGSPPSNLTRIRGVLARAADSLAVALADQTPGAVRLAVEPSEIAWLAEEQFSNRLRGSGWTPVEAADSGWLLKVVVDDISVVYRNAGQTGVFGRELLDRTVSADLRLRASAGEFTEPSVDTRLSYSARDTIATTDVEFVETSYLPFTQGRVPQGGFFSTVLEPVVVIGTIAVAVLLLFTVRSK